MFAKIEKWLDGHGVRASDGTATGVYPERNVYEGREYVVIEWLAYDLNDKAKELEKRYWNCDSEVRDQMLQEVYNIDCWETYAESIYYGDWTAKEPSEKRYLAMSRRTWDGFLKCFIDCYITDIYRFDDWNTMRQCPRKLSRREITILDWGDAPEWLRRLR